MSHRTYKGGEIHARADAGEPGLSCESYGVKVTGPDGDWEAVPNITVSTGRIDELAELIRRNQVSPVTLRDVIEDWL